MPEPKKPTIRVRPTVERDSSESPAPERVVKASRIRTELGGVVHWFTGGRETR